MNYRQLKYAIALSEKKNFSVVAENLKITQPALSKHILSLEEELGVKLFDRSANPVKLTPAGEDFIYRAKEIVYCEDSLRRSMDTFKSGNAGKISIGVTPFRSSYLVLEMIKKVRNKYPGICIQLHEVRNEVLRKEAEEGKYDFSIVNLPVDDALLEIRTLEADKLVLVVPNKLKHLIECDEGEIDFSYCRQLPFAVVSPSQEMRQLFDKLCISSGFHPIIAVEAVGLNTIWAVARSGIAATLLPEQFVRQENTDGMTVFDIKDAKYTRQPVVAIKRDRQLSEAVAYAIEVLCNKKF
ncbi:MAG: LysR family transcriptional regulator [Ruminococcaceae bacterium]|nr:LysR family transcriptional regulator [Oscillospiraceae bacterium]